MQNPLPVCCLAIMALVTGASAADPAPPVVRRLPGNPIIKPEMLPRKDGQNINGPSLIRVPAWLPNPLGKYYLYFADHHGSYIRLAVADHLEGPWKIHQGGVLHLRDVPAAKKHIASPDVHIDAANKELRMYFHGPAKSDGTQVTFCSTSKDGLKFTADSVALCRNYLRAFRWDGWWYGMAKSGQLYRSKDGRTPFERGVNPLPSGNEANESDSVHPRHVAIDRRGNTLLVYYSNIGDAPEHILRATIRMNGDWRSWKATDIQDVLRPELPWEGANIPLQASRTGAAGKRENALRDPALFTDEDGKTYLLYSVAGESGIAIAEISEPPAR